MMALAPTSSASRTALAELPVADVRKRLAKVAADNIGADRANKAAGRKLHTRTEAKALVQDADLHAWLRRRQKRGAEPKPRMYFTRFRRDTLQKCFESIDRDGSGVIDKGELSFALTQLGLDTTHAQDLLREGDRDQDGSISMPEFFALVATVSAREEQRKLHLRTQPATESGEIASEVTSSAAIAHSLKDLVDRASTFPIGLLANAHHISSLVGSFDPHMYEARHSMQPAAVAADAQQAAHGATARHPVNSLSTPRDANEPQSAARDASGGPMPCVELGRDGHLRLPALAPAPIGARSGSASSSSNGNDRASSAPLKSTVHSRWLQRGLTSKGAQLSAMAALSAPPTKAPAAHAPANAPVCASTGAQPRARAASSREPLCAHRRPAAAAAVPTEQGSQQADETADKPKAPSGRRKRAASLPLIS